MARIELKQLAHSYHTHPQQPEDYAVRELDHVWEQGKAYALLGPSGCGKTTLLNLISGLLQPTQGQVWFDDQDVTGFDPQTRNIAQVFQFPVVYDTMTVYDNLAFPLRNRGLGAQVIRSRVQEVAEMLELSHVLKRRACNLTADEKQKISMGRGLVRSDVSAILFDEPLTVIDPHHKWLLRRQLKQVHERFNLTMIYVTHDQLEAMTFADEVAVMIEGQVVQIGAPHELFENPAHTFVGYFIGSPGMNVLPCQLDHGEAILDGIRIAVDPALAAKAQQQGGQLELGIRPEYLSLSDETAPGYIPVRVSHIEDLGTYRIITVRLGMHNLRVKLPEEQSLRGEDAFLYFPPERTKLYAESRLVNQAITSK
ncbi:ABC transporter ATP-binding protein [Candidatus Entotheonella palauensis]|uniref:ABC transporter ATP-binding protein n=1 Tax=Candidatus Entotheonella palauensis TaxID=93172 RepID=UPI000B7CCF16|nr:ABC transporter ATP-binding protein [Candidatus Entotheonella palauensis]